MDLTKKLILLLSIPMVLQLITFFMLANLESQAEEATIRSERARQFAIAIKNFEGSTVVLLRSHTNQQELAADCANPSVIESQWNRMHQDMLTLKEFTRDDSEARQNLDAIDARLNSLHLGYDFLKQSWLRTNRYGFGERRPAWTKLGIMAKGILQQTSELSRRELDVVESISAARAGYRHQSKRWLLLAGAISIGGTLTLAVFLMRNIVGKVNIIRENAQRIVDKRILLAAIGNSDEIGGLDETFHRMAKSLRDAERLREESLMMLNHDLRSPLTSLQFGLDSILRNPLVQKNDGLATQIVRSHETCVRLLDMTKDLLDLDRFSAGEIKLSRVKSDVAPFVIAAFELNESIADRKSISLECEMPVLFVFVDGALLERVMTNLVSNALKFAPAESRILVTARLLGKFVEVCVDDHGPGIPKEKLSTVFERYRQLDEHKKLFQGGNGLGLAICRSIVNLHNGKIRAENLPTGGSRFAFTLPCYEALSTTRTSMNTALRTAESTGV